MFPCEVQHLFYTFCQTHLFFLAKFDKKLFLIKRRTSALKQFNVGKKIDDILN